MSQSPIKTFARPFRARIFPLQTQCDFLRIALFIIATGLQSAKDADKSDNFSYGEKAVSFADTAFLIVTKRKSGAFCEKYLSKGRFLREKDEKTMALYL